MTRSAVDVTSADMDIGHVNLQADSNVAKRHQPTYILTIRAWTVRDMFGKKCARRDYNDSKLTSNAPARPSPIDRSSDLDSFGHRPR